MTNNMHPNTSAMARSFIPGTSPDGAVYAPLIPVIYVGDAQVRCSCTWGDGGNGLLRLRWYHNACRVWQKGGHG